MKRFNAADKLIIILFISDFPIKNVTNSSFLLSFSCVLFNSNSILISGPHKTVVLRMEWEPKVRKAAFADRNFRFINFYSNEVLCAKEISSQASFLAKASGSQPSKEKKNHQYFAQMPDFMKYDAKQWNSCFHWSVQCSHNSHSQIARMFRVVFKQAHTNIAQNRKFAFVALFLT